MKILAIVAILVALVQSPIDQIDERPYDETRKLLQKLETAPANGALRTLFKEAHRRSGALVRALDDSDMHVSVNAQLVIVYVALPELAAKLEQWRQRKNSVGDSFWGTGAEVLPTPVQLSGHLGDPARLVRDKLFRGSRMNVREIGRNKASKTVLLEAVSGDVFTEGHHIVVREERSGWYVVLNRNVWVT